MSFKTKDIIEVNLMSKNIRKYRKVTSPNKFIQVDASLLDELEKIESEFDIDLYFNIPVEWIEDGDRVKLSKRKLS